jgi:hypothetical protein
MTPLKIEVFPPPAQEKRDFHGLAAVAIVLVLALVAVLVQSGGPV